MNKGRSQWFCMHGCWETNNFTASVVVTVCDNTFWSSHPNIVVLTISFGTFGKTVFDNSPTKPCLRKMFLDDTIKFDHLLEYLHSSNASVQFTIEKTQNNYLPIPDAIISRLSAGIFSFAVHKKPNHTGNYLKFHSNHPRSHKRAAVKSLADQANNLCS